MADERIVIEIVDKISPAIAEKISQIAKESRAAGSAVSELQARLREVDAGALAQLSKSAADSTRQLYIAANASQRLAGAYAQAQSAAQRLSAATSSGTTAATSAASATNQLSEAQARSVQSSARASSAFEKFTRTVAAFTTTAFAAGAALKAADSYTVLQNKLQNVADSQQQVNELTQRLYELANRTRAPVQDTAQAFTRFDMALKNMGKSQEDSLKLTETVSKMLTVSGASAEEAGSAMLQLSQGFNKGKLDGDEFRTVMELMPNAAEAIAKSLGVTRGELNKMSSDGKVTSKVLLDAFTKAAAGVDEKFGKTIPTLSQAFVVFKNNASQAFGEVNKQLGLTAGLSNVIIFLANNMKAIAVLATAAGAAMLVAFGPALVSAIVSATRAAALFSATLAANPLGLLIVGIAAASAALAAFGNDITVTADKSITLSDMFAAAFSFVKEAAAVAADFFAEYWDKAFSFISETAHGFGADVSDVFGSFFAVAKDYANALIGVYVGAFNAIKEVWNNFPEVIQGGGNVKGAFMDAIGKDYLGGAADAVGQVGDAVMKRARAIAAARNKEGSGGSSLRGTGPDLTPAAEADEKAAKAALKRSDALAKINKELDNELSRMYLLKPEREAQARFDQIEEQLASNKITLSQQEAAAIREKINAIQQATQVQSAYDRIYEEAISPQREYNANLTAAKMLLNEGAITLQQYNQEVLKSSEALKKAKDPLYELNRELDQQKTLLQMLPKQREIEQQVMQTANELLDKGIGLTKAETAALREKLAVIQQLNAVSQEETALMADSVGKREAFLNQLTAIKNLRSNPSSGFTEGDQAGAADSMLQGMGVDTSNFETGIQAKLDMYQTYNDQVKAMYDQRLITEQEYAAASVQIEMQRQNVFLNSASGFFGNLAQLQKSSNKRIAAVGKAAAIAQAMISTYQSATSAYAAMAGIPYVGPALGAAAAAAAIVAGLANVQQIRSQNAGFKEGGYTGNGGVNEVAGVVHGREFVMNAAATSRVGVANLQALQSGAAAVKRNGDSAGAARQSKPQAAQAAPIVNMPINVSVVQSKEAALAGMRSAEGRSLIIETIEQNGSTVARIVGNR